MLCTAVKMGRKDRFLRKAMKVEWKKINLRANDMEGLAKYVFY